MVEREARRDAEVGHLGVLVRVEEHVGRLDVAVDHLAWVEVRVGVGVGVGVRVGVRVRVARMAIEVL